MLSASGPHTKTINLVSMYLVPHTQYISDAAKGALLELVMLTQLMEYIQLTAIAAMPRLVC